MEIILVFLVGVENWRELDLLRLTDLTETQKVDGNRKKPLEFYI